MQHTDRSQTPVSIRVEIIRIEIRMRGDILFCNYQSMDVCIHASNIHGMYMYTDLRVCTHESIQYFVLSPYLLAINFFQMVNRLRPRGDDPLRFPSHDERHEVEKVATLFNQRATCVAIEAVPVVYLR